MHIRKSLLNQRKSLSPAEQHQASVLVFEKAKRLKPLQTAQNIAFYQAINGEISCKELIEYVWKMGKNVLLPILAGQKLKFIHYLPNHPLIKNPYGIPEPIATPQNTYNASDLDLVFTPLVAFDTQMNRIGMGKGYYDRTFEFLKTQDSPHKPFLVGLAYEFQKIDEIKPEAWDVQLDIVITEDQSY